MSRYQKHISGPLLDCIDIAIEVPRVEYERLSGDGLRRPCAAIRQRVDMARERQAWRLAGSSMLTNAASILCQVTWLADPRPEQPARPQ
jgi:magnesium chelatase family protein